MAGSKTLALTLSDRAQIVALTIAMAGLFWLSTHSTTVIAHVNGSVPGFVKIQSSPPGTQQTGNAYLSGMIRGSLFGGSGANLTGLNATNLVKGKINDSLLSSFVPLKDTSKFSQAMTHFLVSTIALPETAAYSLRFPQSISAQEPFQMQDCSAVATYLAV